MTNTKKETAAVVQFNNLAELGVEQIPGMLDIIRKKMATLVPTADKGDVTKGNHCLDLGL
tara:strand:- start:122 stop:301 length:180 start_codon:yes stop_codon:yes gene_type:complete